MILIYGGTTEGRKAVNVIDQAGKPFYYSTKGDLQEVNFLHGIRLHGAMDAAAMTHFCTENNIHVLVDAAHPFATQLHQTIAEVSEALQLPVIRYERIYPPRSEAIIWCEDYADAIRKLQHEKVNRLLALTGVQTISKLKPFWENTEKGKHTETWQPTETWFRILNREESLSIARNQGFPEGKLLFYQTDNDDSALIRELRPDAIILKESGISGGFTDKVAAALENNVKVFAIKHPTAPDEFYIVDGDHGLRRTIEQLLPGFYPLRTGVTTGSCATAAAVAALTTLLTDKKQTNSTITLPDGEHISIPIYETLIREDSVSCTVIKDSGDDADVTNGIAIVAEIHLTPSTNKERSSVPSVLISGGQGVGKVTLPGLGLEVGGPAINAAPRKMITYNLQAVIKDMPHYSSYDIEVCISVPEGEKIAQRTFNPRLGVVGGISIIGTSGIVQPFSIEAFISSIRKSMEVARASLATRIVINSGAKSEKYLRQYYSDLPDVAFVHYGNYIGETIQIAAELGIHRLTLGIMIGKAVKLAEGYLDTHSKKITMNKSFLQAIAKQSGCSSETIESIGKITLARELWNIIPNRESQSFFDQIIRSCHAHCDPLLPDGELTILLVNESGEIFTPRL